MWEGLGEREREARELVDSEERCKKRNSSLKVKALDSRHLLGIFFYFFFIFYINVIM